jgi:hypothetical protein
MFGIQLILISTVVGAMVSAVVLYVDARYIRSAPFDGRNGLALSVLVALSILFFRLAANVAVLNEDPIPLASPNDLLCPMATYVVLSVYAGLRGALDRTRFEHDRALLTIVSLAVNIVTI